MTGDIVYTLKRKHVISNITPGISDVFTENTFSDVILVSDDKKYFQAHKYILSFFSPVLKEILLENLQSHPLIFLRGVNHQELDSILQFIYLGKVSVNSCSQINKLVNVAKNLQIKKLAERFRIDTPHLHKEDIDIDGDTIDEDKEDKAENYAGRSILDIADELISLDIPGLDEIGQTKQLYRCGECNASYKNRGSLLVHHKSVHKGIIFSCNQCEYQAMHKGHLKRHQKSVHEGVKHSCNQCDYQATRQTSVKKHQKSIHEGVRYSFD